MRILILLSVLLFVSCKKDRICKCTIDVVVVTKEPDTVIPPPPFTNQSATIVPGKTVKKTVKVTDETEYKKVTKSQVKANCLNKVISDGTKYECEIK